LALIGLYCSTWRKRIKRWEEVKGVEQGKENDEMYSEELEN
jgi:hypothetical protein